MAISGSKYESEKDEVLVKYRDRITARSPARHKTVRQRVSTYGAEYTGNVECLECGRFFASLCGHIRKHGITSRQYRERHGARAKFLDDRIYGAGTPLRQKIGDSINANRQPGRCDQCGREIRPKKYEHRLGCGKAKRFCSAECRALGKRNGHSNRHGTLAITRQCGNCGKDFKSYPNSRSHRKTFCCRACYWAKEAQIPNAGRFTGANP